MGNLMTETTSKMSGNSPELKNRALPSDSQLEKFSHETGQRIGAFATDVANTTSNYVKESRDYVRENPGKSVAMAAAAGLVAGSLLTMVMRGRH